MQQTTLADLDDLVLTVRDRNSRAYAAEAISAYRAQAHRAAIISTWIAVVYDIISKCRELAGQSEGEARALIEKLDAAVERQSNGDQKAIPALQDIESSLLDKARDSFEFISHQEHTDLSRLKHDRHLCAHPAFVRQDVLFQPTPELVRTHIVHALLHLLQHPPVQGRSALARLKQDLLQASFPSELDAVHTFLATKYLKHIKPSLLTTLVTVFLKVLVRQSEVELLGREAQVLSSLAAVRQHAAQAYEAAMADQLPRLTDDLKDSELVRVVRLFPVEPRVWGWVTEGVRIRLRTIAATYRVDAGEMDYLFEGLGIPDLRSLLLSAVEKMDEHEREQVVERCPRPEFRETAIALYTKSGSYRVAESRAKDLILPLSDHLTVADIDNITQAVAANVQIYDAVRSPILVLELFKRTHRLHAATRTSWERLSEWLRILGNKRFGGLEKAMVEVGMLP